MAGENLDSAVAAEPAKARGPLLSPEFLRKLEALALMAKRVHVGAAKGERRSRRKGSSVEFADYRGYTQGDDLRHVDWNIVGRLNSLYLKLFQEQEDLTLHVLIDASSSMGFGAPPKIEFACKMAAALGYIALAGFDRVVVEAFRGNESRLLPRCRGKVSAGQLFAFLDGVNAEAAAEAGVWHERTRYGTHLDEWCRGHVGRHRAKGVAVLISDFLDPEGHKECVRRLSVSGSDLYILHVLAREEIEPPISGDLRLIDSETDSFVEISMSRALLKRYRKNLDEFRESLRMDCLRRGIGYVWAPNDTPFERLTLDVLRQGRMLR